MMAFISSIRATTAITTLFNTALIASLFSIAPLPSFAKDTAVTQRDTFIAAEKALKSNKTDEYQKLKASLVKQQYILTPYLEYAEIKKLMSQGKYPTEKVQSFLDAEKNNALGDRLKNSWLYYLGKHKKWELFESFYTPSQDVALQCYDIYARYTLTKNPKILNESKPLWLHGKSQPSACDATFTAWRKTGGLTEPLVWKRIALAMEANQYTVVNYLKRYVSENKQPVVQTWLNTYRDPKIVTSEKLFKGSDPLLRETQIYGIKRTARRDPDKAITLWKKIDKKYTFTHQQRYEAYKSIALSKAMKHQPDALVWFNKIPLSYYDDTMYEWYVRNALLNGHWATVIKMVNQFPKTLRENNQWDYWLARAYEKTGKTQAAQKIYQALAKERSFYGFISSDRQGLPYPLKLPQYTATPYLVKDTLKIPGIARSLELYDMGRTTAARSEWAQTMLKLDEAHLQAAALIATQNNWQSQAILTLTRADNQNNLDMRFPILYKSTIQREAKKQDLNPAWVYAIARRESAFLPDARSPVGARGLMQLMPYTAKHVAQKLKEPYKGTAQLTNPNLNIRLGSAYLNQVYHSNNKNIILATASYNAGPSRVKSWLPKRGSVDADIWIENIPFNETRNYVKAVLIYRMIYQDHLKMKGRLDEVFTEISS